MTSADIKNDVKPKNKKSGRCIFKIFMEVSFQNLKYNLKQACIFDVILVGIPCSLIFFIKSGEDGDKGVRRIEAVFT